MFFFHSYNGPRPNLAYCSQNICKVQQTCIYIMKVSLSSVSFAFTTLSCSSQSFGLPLSVSLSQQIDSNDLGLILISSHTIAIISAPRPDCGCYTTCLARCDALNKDSDFRLIFTTPKGRLLFFTTVSKLSSTSLHKNMYK